VRIRRVEASPGENMEKAKEVCAMHRVSLFSDTDLSTLQTFHLVGVMSKYLEHPNIVPFLGVNTDPLELISDWMPGGDLPGYIANHPNVDRLSLVGVPYNPLCETLIPRQLSDVAEGLEYLHSCDVIHGDLKGVRGPF
jgi:serine/threonine protein kinase